MKTAERYVICFKDMTTGQTDIQELAIDDPSKPVTQIVQDWKQNNPTRHLIHIFDADADLRSCIDSERARFENACRMYGFTPDDYLRRITDRAGHTYEICGFLPANTKYKVSLRNLDTLGNVKATPKWVRDLIAKDAP